MRFTCPVSYLKLAAGKVEKALSVKYGPDDAIGGILMQSFEGGISFRSTDLSIGIEASIEAVVIEEGAVILPGKLFAEIVRKLPDDEVEIRVGGDLKIQIKCRGSRTVLTGLPEDKYPKMTKVSDGNEISVPQRALRAMIQKVMNSIATEETRPILTGALLEIEPDGLTMAALDGFRLAVSRHMMQTGQNSAQIVIPGKTLSELFHLLGDKDEAVGIEIGKQNACFYVNGSAITTRLLEGEFMRYKQIIPQEWSTRVVTPKAAFLEAVGRASVIAAEGSNNIIRISVDKDSVSLSANSESSEICEAVDGVMTEGKPLEIAFNAKYLQDMMRAIDGDEFQMQLQTPLSPGVVRPIEGDAYMFLVLPVRVYSAS